jgi:serine/threonine protein kinase
MAELLKARATGQHGFEKMVALKKILPHLANDPQFVEMFYDEARLTAQLDHPNIVQVFELGTDSDTPYIAMQFVDGLDVLGLLRECARAQIRLPADLAALIARDVLDALDYAHNAIASDGKPLGIVHRDISPGNVLLSWRGDVKLTDFGIARAAERRHKTEAGTLKGKYGYMSPEQVSGAEVDPRSDLFSVGILLAEMVMARRLFTSTNDLDILLMVRDARLDRLHKYASEFPG